MLALATRLISDPAGGAIDWLELPAVELGAAALLIRRAWLGSRIRTEALCPAPECDEAIDVAFGIQAYLEHHAPRPRSAVPRRCEPGWFALRGQRSVFAFRRSATSSPSARPTAPRPRSSSAASAPPTHPPRSPGGSTGRSRAVAPRLDGEVSGTCPGCGHAISLRFEPIGYVLEELRAASTGLFAEVHELAASYHSVRTGDPPPHESPPPRLRGPDPWGARARMSRTSYLGALAGGDRHAATPALRPPRRLFPPTPAFAELPGELFEQSEHVASPSGPRPARVQPSGPGHRAGPLGGAGRARSPSRRVPWSEGSVRARSPLPPKEGRTSCAPRRAARPSRRASRRGRPEASAPGRSPGPERAGRRSRRARARDRARSSPARPRPGSSQRPLQRDPARRRPRA